MSLNLKEIFEGMVKGFDAEEAKGWETVIQYNITEEMKVEGDMNDLFRMASVFRTKGE